MLNVGMGMGLLAVMGIVIGWWGYRAGQGSGVSGDVSVREQWREYDR